ncbi:MAG: hypothetical protein NW241_09080 [Bacteroidia bacterium]|nr:hypothetical protein [Bacteroidia bacterium]
MRIRKLLPLCAVTAALLLASCRPDPVDPGGKGLVSFKADPVYAASKVEFAVQIQFTGGGGATAIEYTISDGASVIRSGTAQATVNPDGLKIFYESAAIAEPIDAAAYSGKTLTVRLDPDDKATLGTYTTPTYTELYRTATFIVN